MRRAGHEIRNALNGVSVNVEVVRSRTSRDDAPKEVASFAERASAQVSEASALTDGALALIGAVLTAATNGTLRPGPGNGAASEIELMIYGERGPGVVSEIRRLGERIGVGVEERGQTVILKVSPEGHSHSKE